MRLAEEQAVLALVYDGITLYRNRAFQAKMSCSGGLGVWLILNKEYIYTELIGGTGTINMTLSLIESGNAPNPLLYQFQEENWNKIDQEMINWCIAREPEAIHESFNKIIFII